MSDECGYYSVGDVEHPWPGLEFSAEVSDKRSLRRQSNFAFWIFRCVPKTEGKRDYLYKGETKMCKKLVLLLCVVLICSTAMAQLWTPGASGDWSNPANWVGGVVPAAGGSINTGMVMSDFSAQCLFYYNDWAHGGDDPPGTPVNPLAAQLFTMLAPSAMGWTNQTIETAPTDVISLANLSLCGNADDRMARATLNIRTNVAVTGEFALSSGDYGYATVNQFSGDVTVGDSIRIPRRYTGIYNMYGGTMSAPHIYMPRNGSGWAFASYLGTINFDNTSPDGLLPDDGIVNPTDHTTLDGYFPNQLAKSALNIFGGVVTTKDLSLPTGNLPNGKVTIAGGTLVLVADPLNQWDLATLISQVTAKMANGQLVAANPVQFPLVVTVNDLGGGEGSITITPEPMTMIMLGLGALGLLRRRK